MKIKRVNRYYCDFCKKANCSSGAMRLHERHCTMNPSRTCRMCRGLRDIPALTKLVSDTNLTFIQRSCGNCPACTLAVLRQSGKSTGMFDFDYKKEAQKWFTRWDDFPI